MAYITRIHIEQCRNVRLLDVDLSAPARENGMNGSSSGARPRFRHLILTGPNGSGKSGVLEAVAAEIEQTIAPSEQLVLPIFGMKKNELAWNVEPRLLHAMFARGDVLAAYLPARRRVQPREVRGPTKGHRRPEELRPMARAASTLAQFLANKHVEMTYATVNGDTDVVERIRSWFDSFEHNLRRLMEDEQLDFVFDNRSFNFTIRKSDGYAFDLHTLADGHASVIAILAELLIRIDAIQRLRTDYTFIPQGVVVIDEIETHLHLSLQEKILPFLVELFPTFQFVVATHSPAVIASIPNAVVYDLRKREPVLSDHLRGIRYGMLMTEHFGISSEIDLDSTEKLIRLRDLAARNARTPDEERELADLSTLLTNRSRSLAVEVWMAKERLGYASPAEAKQ